MYSEIIVDGKVTRLWYFGMAQHMVNELTKSNIAFEWYFGGVLQK